MRLAEMYSRFDAEQTLALLIDKIAGAGAFS
jgi:hypothetical protein